MGFMPYKVINPMLPRKTSWLMIEVAVPQTDTRRQGEDPKALERTLAKELCKFTP